MWKPSKSSKFKKQYDSLSSETQKKIDDAIRQLLESENPMSFGVYKTDIGLFAYELGRSERILYNVLWDLHYIDFVRVGSHKQVYGRG